MAVVIPEIFRAEIREIIFAEVAEGMNSNSDKTDPMRGMSRLLLSWNTTESWAKKLKVGFKPTLLWHDNRYFKYFGRRKLNCNFILYYKY